MILKEAEDNRRKKEEAKQKAMTEPEEMKMEEVVKVVLEPGEEEKAQ